MLEARRYGDRGPTVFVLHGGPGAPGEMAPVARGLADSFRVVEPLQRRSGDVRLGVDRHVEDLHELITTLVPEGPLGVVGSSWGAMLALAYAAAHPSPHVPLVLVGCGTFDPEARARFRANLAEASGGSLEEELARIDAEVDDPQRALSAKGALHEGLYVVDPLPAEDADALPVDATGHEETWDDMLRLQAEGRYPAAFERILAPVLMLHGAEDPHPGAMIRDSLLAVLPQLEYLEWQRCGHYPWRERGVRASFFGILEAWLKERLREE